MPTFDTPEPILLTVELGVGDLRIIASDRADTVVEVEPSDPAKPSDVTAAARTGVEYANGVLEIKAHKGRKRFRGGGESIEVRIEVPTGTRLRGQSGLGGVRCSGTLGDCRYKTGLGDITIEEVAGEVELTTGLGEVRVGWIGGLTTVTNGNGDTWIGEVVGDLQVKAANGRIAVDQAHRGGDGQDRERRHLPRWSRQRRDRRRDGIGQGGRRRALRGRRLAGLAHWIRPCAEPSGCERASGAVGGDRRVAGPKLLRRHHRSPGRHRRQRARRGVRHGVLPESGLLELLQTPLTRRWSRFRG